jgi:hypothetical protein
MTAVEIAASVRKHKPAYAAGEPGRLLLWPPCLQLNGSELALRCAVFVAKGRTPDR